MTQTTIQDRTMQNIRFQTPGAIDAVIQLELYNTVMEFLNDSKAWWEDLTVSVQPSVTSYDLDTASSDIAFLMSLLDENQTPVEATMSEPGTIVLRYTPSTAKTLTARVAYKPNRTDADGYPVFPEWIWTKYYMHLVAGAVSRLMTQAAKPYSNPTMAVYHMRKFRNGVSIARAETEHANLYNGQAWAFPLITPSLRK